MSFFFSVWILGLSAAAGIALITLLLIGAISMFEPEPVIEPEVEVINFIYNGEPFKIPDSYPYPGKYYDEHDFFNDQLILHYSGKPSIFDKPETEQPETRDPFSDDDIPIDACDGTGCPEEESEDSGPDQIIDTIINGDSSHEPVTHIPGDSTPDPSHDPSSNDPDGNPGTGIPGMFEPDTIETEDPDPNIKNGKDPFVNNDNPRKPWLIVVGNSLNCEMSGVQRGHYDNDKWLECPSYKFAPGTKVLMNNPVIDEPYNYENFLGRTFTHIWIDNNQDMRYNLGDTMIEQKCNILDTDVWGFQQHQVNGNISTGKYYCSEIQEHFYAVDVVYWMKGI